MKIKTVTKKLYTKQELLKDHECFSNMSCNEAVDLVELLNNTATYNSTYVVPSSKQLREAVRSGESFDRNKRYLTSDRSATGHPIGLRVFGTFPKFKEYDVNTSFEVRLLNVTV